MTAIITICGNTETILSSHDVSDLSHEMCEELAIEWCDHVAQQINAAALAGSDVDSDVCHEFRAYDGGKFAHQAATYGNTGGLVSCKIDAPQAIKDLCDKARAAADAVLAESIEQELAK